MDKPNGLFVIKPHQVQSFIDSLPIEKIFGVGKVTATKMKGIGIFEGKHLKPFTENELVKKFGKSGHYFYNVARGIDNRPVVPNRERKSLGAESTFNEDYNDQDVLLEKLNKVAQKVAKHISKSKVKPLTITVKIKFADFTQITRSKTVSEPIRSLEIIDALSKALLIEALNPNSKVRLLGITLSNFEKEIEKAQEQLTLEF